MIGSGMPISQSSAPLPKLIVFLLGLVKIERVVAGKVP
jgi:hypothetical protein